MKIKTACLREGVRHPALPRAKLDIDIHGDEMSFEAGLLTVKTKAGFVAVFPVHTVLWMEPAPVSPKKLAKTDGG